tara:strand:+ start:722 stop:1132 length:411 start_codon:yes stop_codon:yes gene_type:complete
LGNAFKLSLLVAFLSVFWGEQLAAQGLEIRGVKVVHPDFPVAMCDSGGEGRTCERMVMGKDFPDQIVFYSHDDKNFGAYQIRFLDEQDVYWIPDDMIVVEGKEIARRPVVCGGEIGALGGKGTRGAGADCIAAKGN